MGEYPYKTPPGQDNSLVPSLPQYTPLEKYGVTAHKFLNSVICKGGKYNINLLEEIAHRRNTNQSVVINFTGPPGIGKTYSAMAFAMIFDNRFHILDTPPPEPSEDTGHLCFTRQHMMHLLGEDSPLKRGEVMIIDEAHFGMGSRTYQNRDQIDVVNIIAAARSKGIILFIVTLHSKMLDKIPREYVVNYEFKQVARGKIKAYYRWFPTFAHEPYHKSKGILNLPLPQGYNPQTGEGCDYSDCLNCNYLYDDRNSDGVLCRNTRAIYERRKEYFVNSMTSNGKDEEKNKKLSDEEIVKILYESVDSLGVNNQNNIDINTVIPILKELNAPSGSNSAYRYRSLLTKEHPDLLSLLRETPQ